MFAIDWSGPNALAMSSPWGTLWVPGSASHQSEAAFWGENGLKGPCPTPVWGRAGSRERGPTTAVLWGHRCCQNGNVGLVRAEVEPVGTSLALGLSFPERVEDGPHRQCYYDLRV